MSNYFEMLCQRSYKPNKIKKKSKTHSYIYTGCLKKRNLFNLEYLKYASVKLIVLLLYHLILPTILPSF